MVIVEITFVIFGSGTSSYYPVDIAYDDWVYNHGSLPNEWWSESNCQLCEQRIRILFSDFQPNVHLSDFLRDYPNLFNLYGIRGWRVWRVCIYHLWGMERRCWSSHHIERWMPWLCIELELPIPLGRNNMRYWPKRSSWKHVDSVQDSNVDRVGNEFCWDKSAIGGHLSDSRNYTDVESVDRHCPRLLYYWINVMEQYRLLFFVSFLS